VRRLAKRHSGLAAPVAHGDLKILIIAVIAGASPNDELEPLIHLFKP